MQTNLADHLGAEAFGPLGDRQIMWVDCAATDAEGTGRRYARATRAIVAGIDRAGTCPPLDPASFDMLLTTAKAPPSPWVAVAAARMDERIAAIEARVAHAPLAAGVAIDVARACDYLPFDLGIAIESLGYSTLLAGDEFRAWRRSRARVRAVGEEGGGPQVRVDARAIMSPSRWRGPTRATRCARRCGMRCTRRCALCWTIRACRI